MLIDFIGFILIAALGFVGWRRGTLLTFLAGASLLGGYIAAHLFYRPVGAVFRVVFGASPLVAYPLGGMIVLFAASIGFKVLTNRVRKRRARLADEGIKPTIFDRGGGALIGGVWALGITVLLGWGASVFGGLTGNTALRPMGYSGRLTQAVIGGTVHAIARSMLGDDMLASAIASVVVNPAVASESLGQLVSDPRFQALLRDGDLRNAIAHNDYQALARNPVFSELIADRDFLDAAEDVNLIGNLREDAHPFMVTQQLTDRIAPLVRSVESLSHDPEIQRILHDPNFASVFERGDLGALVGNEDVNRLLQRVLETLRENQ